MPSAVFIGADGARHAGLGLEAPGGLPRGGAGRRGQPGQRGQRWRPLDAIERFGRSTTKEAEVLSGHPGPVICAELWNLAKDRRLRPVRALTGTIWEKA